ncbi:MAG: hypothetical protein KGI00_02685 [Candidatus Micrarchaeota archaeon]|nr:hypothetical protein [Candidatus Micrarchaeota archaeon]MDE1824454.1 hypothetical protein [Candidatus Micrarchaeota archaeon]MDE1849613.1 hypothetical protein [Candidatus Micrarchaeota archaeon]
MSNKNGSSGKAVSFEAAVMDYHGIKMPAPRDREFEMLLAGQLRNGSAKADRTRALSFAEAYFAYHGDGMVTPRNEAFDRILYGNQDARQNGTKVKA